MSTPEPNKIIYSMVGVSRYYDKKPVLKDIYLSYFYGAKIGVIGLNGSGKSTLLRIIAGTDKGYVGETVLSPGHTVGYLEQEPQLDPAKTVREVVEEGAQEAISLLKEYDEINARFGEPLDDDELQMRTFWRQWHAMMQGHREAPLVDERAFAAAVTGHLP